MLLMSTPCVAADAVPGIGPVGEVKQGRQIRFLFLPEGHDPDSLVGEEGAPAFEERIAAALPLADYLIRELVSRTDVDSVDGRARLVELAKPLVQRIPSEVYRELLVSQLAAVVRMPAGRLAELLGGPADRGEASELELRAAQVGRGRSSTAVGAGRGNLVRRAISLLVHYPACAAAVTDVEPLAQVKRPGVPLLMELLTQLREDPPGSTAMLLERWRDRPEHGPLAKLAMTESIVPNAESAGSELRSAVDLLVRQTLEERLDELVAKEKSRPGSLTVEETQELQGLLKARVETVRLRPAN